MAIRGNRIEGAIGWVAGAAIVAMALPAAASDGPSGPESRSTFKSGIDVVALSVTVLDPQARLLAGLSRDKFSVFEDGVRQDIAYFETSEVPLDLALLIDSSVSMEPKLAFVQKAAAGFVDALREGDRAAVFAFNSYVRPLQAFTADRSLVRQAIQSTTAAGGTALYNAVYVALRAFDKVAEDGRVRRRAIVVLTDGEDTASVLTFDDLMAEAKAAGVAIYTIGLHAEEPGRYAAQQTPRLLLDRRLRDEAAGPRDGRQGVLPDRPAVARRGLRRDRARAGDPVRHRLRVPQPDAQRRLPAGHGPRQRQPGCATAHADGLPGRGAVGVLATARRRESTARRV